MNLRKFTFILTLLIAAGLSAFSQSDTIGVKTIIAKARKYNDTHPVEKVYVHFDKPYYAVSDTMWFKVYLTIDVHQPSLLSKVVYVDILNSRDSIVQKLKLPVLGGTAFGDIILDKVHYRQDNYHIRAYTNWTRNYDPAYFFHKTIPVGNAVVKEIFTNISLTGSVKNNSAKVDAVIHYNTADGRAYANRKVSWKVLGNDDETVVKGKGTTDALGNVTIAFTSGKVDAVKAAMLMATIDLDNKSFNSSYPLLHVVAPMDVQFFPEGGDMIANIKGKIAFKAIKPDGLGVDAKGTVTDNTGAVVANITTQHLGMGVFELLPVSGKSYKANITFPDGSQNTYNLPAVKNDGIAISVASDADKYNITYTVTDAFLKANEGKLIATVGQFGQLISYAAQTALTTKSWVRSIAKNTLVSGLLKITVFAPNGDAMAERTVFVQRNDQLNIDLKTEKPSYAPRQKVTVNVVAKNAGIPADANLSVTVVDETKVPYQENSETTILTSILLTSDLKGYVEKPNYYFNKPNDKTAADLDVLTLTQGYSRFVYKDLLANTIPPVKFFPEDGIEIFGTLRRGDGMALKGVVNFSIKDKHISVTTNTNQLGEFKFSKLYFPDSVTAVLDAKGTYGNAGLMILPANPSYLAPTPNKNAPDEVINIDTALNAYLKNSKQQSINSHVLKEVIIREKTVEKKPSHVDYPALMGLSMLSDQEIPGKNMLACSNLFDCLQAMAFGLIYSNNNLFVRRGHVDGDDSNPAAIYYNGLPVDYSFLRTIEPKDVESVEVFLNDGLSGVNRNTGTRGVVVVNAKKVERKVMSKDQIKEALAALSSSAITISPKGYAMPVAFYNPKYNVAGDSPIGGDLRSTIFWSPKVFTDKATGNASFEYFNADAKGTYRIIIEGIDAEGNIGRTVYRYKVQ